MTDDLKQTLLRFHAFTGNNYVSSFFTEGKTASWKKMVHQKVSGIWFVVGDLQELFKVIEELLCSIYGFSCSSVSNVRGKMFGKRLSQERRSPDLSLLPPVNLC